MLRGLVLLPPLRLLPFFLLLLTAPTAKGLNAGRNNFQSCNGGSGSFIDGIICDPDHLVPPEESCSIVHLLTRCGREAGQVRMLVFLADSFIPDAESLKPINTATTAATTTTTTTASTHGSSEDSNPGVDTSRINLLRELVVASNKLNSSTTSFTNTKINNSCATYSSYSSSASDSAASSIILLVAIKDPFQLAMWHSSSLDGVMARNALEEAEQRINASRHQLHFTSAVVHVAHQLCQSARPCQPRTVQDIILTIAWIAFTSAFIALLVVIVVTLLRARHRAVRSRARAEAGQDKAKRKESCRQYPITSASDIQDLSVIYYKSGGNVLLATTDITAIPAQDCSSTDNLLQG